MIGQSCIDSWEEIEKGGEAASIEGPAPTPLRLALPFVAGLGAEGTAGEAPDPELFSIRPLDTFCSTGPTVFFRESPF